LWVGYYVNPLLAYNIRYAGRIPASELHNAMTMR
jgi:hypothetical protein